ncbi:hypothetical protein [Limnoglobus roseus]|uniref:Uncharacterized protein n=1 Tax=Limnoglobus roseus TaxID=2598579 RepID=A0A5C1AFV0_9BACT|nr:hypothetical protein [Limnoglobus roseus]QEL18309.1 hypothetical protein PX52LOC_05330 [Limnoglobus roseus]
MANFRNMTLVWNIYRGTSFGGDLEFNQGTEDGPDYDLTGMTVVVTIGDTVYRSGVAPQLTVPVPTNGVAQFRLADADTAAMTEPRYPLTVDIDNGGGSTTRYWDGVVYMA